VRRQTCTRVFAGALIAGVTFGRLPTAGQGSTGRVRTTAFAVGRDVDGIVIRGTWRARVTLGLPGLTLIGTPAEVAAVSITREKTTLTVVLTAREKAPVPELRATLTHLRGLATSGAVFLTLDDHSGAPLFLDLAGAGTAHGRGSIPLLRVTTSGTVRADLTALKATNVRVHARQASRLAVHARDGLTIVALDTARVSYEEEAGPPQVTVRDAATVERR
jgi:hypothetical protein